MTIKLEAKTRTVTGKKTHILKTNKKVPAVLYGHGITNKNLEIDYLPFEKIYNQAGENTIVDLSIDGAAPVKVLVVDIQNDPIKHRITHADLHQIRMDEKLRTNITIKLIGEAPAVKEFGGVLVHNLSEIEVECLPADLIHEIDVEVSKLKTFNDVITVKDLNLPASLQVVGHGANDVVATVTRVAVEKEPEPVVAAEGVATPEGAPADAAKSGSDSKKPDEAAKKEAPKKDAAKK